jgi:surface antigen
MMKLAGTSLLTMVVLAGCGGGEAQEEAVDVSDVTAAANTYNYISVCPSPAGGRYSSSDIDAWSFYKCECTSYAADKLNERGVAFNNNYKGVLWGNASNWKNAATAAGVTVTSTPKAGDIAWWSSGHVAYVDSVNSNGTANISEYNWGTAWNYGTRSGVTANSYIRP